MPNCWTADADERTGWDGLRALCSLVYCSMAQSLSGTGRVAPRVRSLPFGVAGERGGSRGGLVERLLFQGLLKPKNGLAIDAPKAPLRGSCKLLA